MVSKVLELIRAHRAEFLDRSVNRIIEVVAGDVTGGVVVGSLEIPSGDGPARA